MNTEVKEEAMEWEAAGRMLMIRSTSKALLTTVNRGFTAKCPAVTIQFTVQKVRGEKESEQALIQCDWKKR